MGSENSLTSRQKFSAILIVVLIIGICAGTLGAVAGGAAVYTYLQSRTEAAAQGMTDPSAAVQETELPANILTVDSLQYESAITKAVEVVSPAVVTVVTDLPDQKGFFGTFPGGQSTGSGFIISNDGYIVTNNHVIEGGVTYQVILQSGEDRTAELIGSDKFSDLAILKVDGEMPAVAVLGNSDALRPGETAIAIGSPLGDFKNSVTVGVISATGRSIDTGDGYQIEGMLQTDAAINEGNSGGPLVNLSGEVVGVNTMIIRSGSSASVEGMGFAIPSTDVKVIGAQIIQQGYVSRPYIGIRYQYINPTIASRYNLPVQWGVYVSGVIQNSPAEIAGLQAGDIIIQLGDIPIDETHPYYNTLFSFAPGDEIELRFIRNNTEKTVQLVLSESR